jgi:predicted RNA-binding Zn ribbon-like protein
MLTGSCQRSAVDRFDAGPQPAGRAPAPGRLAYVQAFLNSFWDLERHGADRWEDAAGYGAWLAERAFGGPEPGAGDLARALAAREALRALCLANHGRPDEPEPPSGARDVLDRIAADVAPGAALVPWIGAAHAALDPAGTGSDAAIGLALAIVSVARADGSFPRLKACPHADCGWVFHDASRNRSAQWCSMTLCGNRTKGAAFRRRALR